MPKHLSNKELCKLLNLTQAQVNYRVKTKTLPPPVKIGIRSVAYFEEEVNKVIQAQLSGRSPEEVTALVEELVQNRLK